MVSGDYIASRILATFDGLAIVHYEFLEGGSGEGFVAYTVSPEGVLVMAIPPSGYQYGNVNPDGSVFTVVDTDATGLVYLMVGIKRH